MRLDALVGSPPKLVGGSPRRAWQARLFAPVDLASLAVFRITFGLLMATVAVRFVARGWVQDLYLAPTMHFPFFGLDFVVPWNGHWMYAHFGVIAVSALFVALGLYYRWSALVLTLAFVYVELIDKSVYLNHYYLFTLLSALLVCMPADRMWSLDARRLPQLRASEGPVWPVILLRFQIGCVYLFAGLAKVNEDWLLRGEPLARWLPVHAEVPWVGALLAQPETALAASWAGALFDLSVVPLLCYRRTRMLAYLAVVAFHLFTGMLFPIGVFPLAMILLTPMFFTPGWPRMVLGWLGSKNTRDEVSRSPETPGPGPRQHLVTGALALYVLLQVLVPLRHRLYPGDSRWTHEGFRFSWQVMLIEKTGHGLFDVWHPGTDGHWTIHPREFLTPLQERTMTTRPDMIRQFASMLERHFEREGFENVQVRARVWASLNGSPSRLLVDPEVDLTEQSWSLGHAHWILSRDGESE